MAKKPQEPLIYHEPKASVYMGLFIAVIMLIFGVFMLFSLYFLLTADGRQSMVREGFWGWLTPIILPPFGAYCLYHAQKMMSRCAVGLSRPLVSLRVDEKGIMIGDERFPHERKFFAWDKNPKLTLKGGIADGQLWIADPSGFKSLITVMEADTSIPKLRDEIEKRRPG